LELIYECSLAHYVLYGAFSHPSGKIITSHPTLRIVYD
jgi:hypothetical protein